MTTAISASWDISQPILFLGEWCKLYENSNAIDATDHITASYHWDNREKYIRDYDLLSSIYERHLYYLANELNAMHQVTGDIKFWRIIIGPWLRYFVDAVYDRYESICNAARTDGFNDTLLLNYSMDDWIPKNFNEFYVQLRDDPWNHLIYSECIKHLDFPYSDTDVPLLASDSLYKQSENENNLKNKILANISRIIPSKLNQVVLVGAYLPRYKQAKLQLFLGQIPYLQSPFIRATDHKIDKEKREQLRQGAIKDHFEQLLSCLISKLMPYAYLEGFGSLYVKALNQFPKSPKVIVTSNSYHGDDAFKVWAAHHHVMNNIPYIIAQHGGHYGIGKVYQTEDHQITSSGQFASWGWRNSKYTNIVPMPPLKVPGKNIGHKQDGDILILLASLPRYFYCHISFPVAGQFSKYLDNQMSMISSLSDDNQGNIKIRLDTDTFGWNVRERLEDSGFAHMLEDMSSPLNKRLQECRLAVSTYNATTFLETLAMNFPTVVYLAPEQFEIRDEAKAYLDVLENARILHYSPASAAAHIDEISCNVNDWWESMDVQQARKQFCSTYVNTSPQCFKVWREYLQDIMVNNTTGIAG